VRPVTSVLLAVASGAVVVGSLIGAWRTVDFWETIPMVPCVVGAGLLAAFAVYVGFRRPVAAVLLGLVVSLATFVGTALITLARWEG
jgi:hypothetical protein